MDSSWTTLVSLTCFHYCVVFLCFGHIRELRDSVFIQMMIAKERMRYKALINMTSSMMNGRITFSVEWWFRTTKNRDVSTGPIAHPFARSLTPLTALLTPLRSFVCFFAHSPPCLWESGLSEVPKRPGYVPLCVLSWCTSALIIFFLTGFSLLPLSSLSRELVTHRIVMSVYICSGSGFWKEQ